MFVVVLVDHVWYNEEAINMVFQCYWSVVSLGVFSTPSNPFTLIKWRCIIIDFDDFGCLHDIPAGGYKKYRGNVQKKLFSLVDNTKINFRLSKAKQDAAIQCCISLTETRANSFG
jgi:hypothetical protein